MQIEWLRAFVLLKEKMNFSEAAEEMFISQSSFSKYIKALENSLDVPLIDRSRRALTFTEKGESVYSYACAMLEIFDKMLDSVKEAPDQNQPVRISVDSAANAFDTIRSVLTYFDQHPSEELVLQEYDMVTALKAFDAGELDLILGHSNLFNPHRRYNELRLMEEELFYVGNPETMAAFTGPAAAPVSLLQVVNDRLILHQNMYNEILRLLDLSGIRTDTMRPIVTTTSRDVLKAYLQSGSARSILTSSEFSALSPSSDLVRISMTEKPVLTLGILYKKASLTSAARDLLKYLKKSDGGENNSSGPY